MNIIFKKMRHQVNVNILNIEIFGSYFKKLCVTNILNLKIGVRNLTQYLKVERFVINFRKKSKKEEIILKLE